ncbi:DUF4350 domain-containing protein [Streptomyces sp. NPDC059452]|uniref:DUF4350 domain-containing protein n=1 Tax=Streptomyces sp. NPDC059452 TaxID=3346835 RepID=UPI00368FFA2F
MTTATAPSPTSTALPPRQVWKRVQGVLIVLLVLVIAGVTFAAVRSGTAYGHLDPRSAGPKGSRAAAELLKERGVSVTVATTLDDAIGATGPDTTLLVTGPNLLTPSQQRRLHGATTGSDGRTLLIAPGPSAASRLAPGVRAEPHRPVSTLPPSCTLPAARNAGTVDMGGIRYTARDADATACYPSDGTPSLLLLKDGKKGDTVLLGSPDFLHNERLAHQGNASLALQLLGSRPHLVWYLPSLADPSATSDDGISDDTDDRGDEEEFPGEESSFLELIPSGWLWGTLQLTLAAALAAIWRGRRLGPLVMERLPVSIRASESAEGRAGLYRKANARDRAAESLRAAARTRIARLADVPTHEAHTSAVLLPAVSARTTTTSDDLSTLLFGPAPADDAALVLLAEHLDALEREVRTS